MNDKVFSPFLPQKTSFNRFIICKHKFISTLPSWNLLACVVQREFLPWGQFDKFVSKCYICMHHAVLFLACLLGEYGKVPFLQWELTVLHLSCDRVYMASSLHFPNGSRCVICTITFCHAGTQWYSKASTHFSLCVCFPFYRICDPQAVPVTVDQSALSRKSGLRQQLCPNGYNSAQNSPKMLIPEVLCCHSGGQHVLSSLSLFYLLSLWGHAVTQVLVTSHLGVSHVPCVILITCTLSLHDFLHTSSTLAIWIRTELISFIMSFISPSGSYFAGFLRAYGCQANGIKKVT